MSGLLYFAIKAENLVLELPGGLDGVRCRFMGLLGVTEVVSANVRLGVTGILVPDEAT